MKLEMRTVQKIAAAAMTLAVMFGLRISAQASGCERCTEHCVGFCGHR